MAMRWRLWEDDFHASMFDASAECLEDDTAKPCRCSGRGRPRPQLADLRLPYALRVQRDNERRGVKGKGRAHVLQQRAVSSKGPGRHHKSNPLDDICSVSSGSSCSSPSFSGQFDAGQFSGFHPSASERVFSGSDSGHRHHVLDLSCDDLNRGRHSGFGASDPDRNRFGFGVRCEEPQLDLMRDFPPLCGNQGSEGGTVKIVSSMGEIAHSLIRSDNKVSHQETVDSEQILGNDVVVIRGLPPNCKETILKELLSPYGRVLQCQCTSASSSHSATFVVRFDSTEACEWAVSCLHDMEGFPGSKITVQFHKN